MSNVKESLTKVLNDLIGNRANLAGQVEIQKQQIGVNESQLGHFDVIIASVRHQLADATGDLEAKVEELLKSPDLHTPVVPPAPLAAAGDAAESAGASSAQV